MKNLESLFLKCCSENNLEKVQACLTLEVDVNAVYALGINAAYLAARMGYAGVIRLLAATEQVDWDKKDSRGWTPLHVALHHGHSDVVGIIAKLAGVKFSLKSICGFTTAMFAVMGGNVRCVEILAEQENCDCWNIPDPVGDTPLLYPVGHQKEVQGHPECSPPLSPSGSQHEGP